MKEIVPTGHIGLLGHVQWLSGRGAIFTMVLLAMLLLGMPMLLARIGESRALPLNEQRQFRSFFPGVLLMAATGMMLLMMARNLPAEARWYNSLLMNVIVQVAAFMAAVLVTRAELKQGVYPRRAIFSPTKLYVNFVIYGVYGYVFVQTLLALLCGSVWSMPFVIDLFLALIPALWWLGLTWKENTLGTTAPDQIRAKAAHAHVEGWKPIWKK